MECIQYGVAEKALDSDSEELDFRPGSATVGGGGARGIPLSHGNCILSKDSAVSFDCENILKSFEKV